MKAIVVTTPGGPEVLELRDVADPVPGEREVVIDVRASALRTAEQVHATLDERQRKQLADMIEAGPWGYAGC